MPSSRIHKAMGVVTSDLTEFETYTPSLNMAIRFHRKPMAKGKVGRFQGPSATRV